MRYGNSVSDAGGGEEGEIVRITSDERGGGVGAGRGSGSGRERVGSEVPCENTVRNYHVG